ncbi:cytochrome-c peroxidase [Fulvivirga lutimaris]|uniref:cytochrome-c peroxidase n=1 Tax=Fulvivirga lutimaris TaxID=1819566 RepID=UPI0012BD01D1|nr:cytochrome c peroxidase [Fulvivirga lutimaris]MTI39934.1 cytochrome-c peroxidase [Fulvivirga lutimaris]
MKLCSVFLLFFIQILVLSSCMDEEIISDDNDDKFIFPVEFGDPNHPVHNITTQSGATLGRMLFYDKTLSRNDSVSCSSCHKQQFAFADNDKFSIGIRNQKTQFNSPSLVNLAYAGPLNWDGKNESLEIQALSPITNIHEMDQRLAVMIEKLESNDEYSTLFYNAFGDFEITVERVSLALSQFQRSIISNKSKFDQYLVGNDNLTDGELDGFLLFQEIGCSSCHAGVLFSGSAINYDGFANNGLDPEKYLRQGLMGITNSTLDKGKFKIQTLRNIDITGPYMHDGRFATLEEVIDHYSKGIKISASLDSRLKDSIIFKDEKYGFHFSDEEKANLLKFLNTLTDHDLITNPRYSDPFNN